ncbi:hypothetical protein FE257_009968 [Aspergillus nanangensis]|uniref:Glycoside hydrolase n=1 Tax=Aspergillus nanangensis TaxID=2582783 RepID=A0AAD4CWJ8_ASPNN|nr:hypothetical protein FE257_009968 [Aspergillus nanangensis]
MRLFYTLAILSWGATKAHAQVVCAHFMAANAQTYSEKDWKNDISLAKEAHIDAFALNMAHSDVSNKSLTMAFDEAQAQGFKLFISFDYAGNGSWPIKDTINLMDQFKDHPAYFKYESRPVMSTFEGASSRDWPKIKNETDSFFIPDWSSLAPNAANKTFVDGLFNWAAWPTGPSRMNTDADHAYIDALNGRPYMMPVSPWFYTNMPGFGKNWVSRGDDLWYDRWQQVLDLQPELVEIISWNDYGESHYIGPLRDKAFGAFSVGKAPFNYAKNMPHDGWRKFLPYVIDQYKNPNKSIAITKEDVVTWYRLRPKNACNTGGTTGNSKSQGVKEYPPSEIVEDKVFYSALLNSTADVVVEIGDKKVNGKWANVPDGGRGLYHGSVPFDNSVGEVRVSIARNQKEIASIKGKAITAECPDDNKGMQNYNAWVGAGNTLSLSLRMSSFLAILVVAVVELGLF